MPQAETGKYRFFRYFVRSMEDIELILTDFSGAAAALTRARTLTHAPHYVRERAHTRARACACM
eukprot:4054278-Pleurochrysis_carterae.AAC.1